MFATRPPQSVVVAETVVRRRSLPSTAVYSATIPRLATFWLHGATKLSKCRLIGAKESPRNSRRGRSLEKAEGTGLEPATPCGAPHFQLGLRTFHHHPRTPKAVHGCGFRATPKIRDCSLLSGDVRPFGYKLATRVQAGR